jgi:hypothetical protein
MDSNTGPGHWDIAGCQLAWTSNSPRKNTAGSLVTRP